MYCIFRKACTGIPLPPGMNRYDFSDALINKCCHEVHIYHFLFNLQYQLLLHMNLAMNLYT